jgi:acetyl esterase
VPVNPQAQVLLDQLAAAGGPSLQEMTPEEARQTYRMLAQLSPAEDIHHVDDRHVPTPDGDVLVRVYTPAAAVGAPAPLLMWFHGGGWVIGDLETADGTCRALANRSGAVVVSVDYRLAPEHPFPAAADDALEAVLWAVEQAEVLGVDPTKVAVGGDSAGGNLAAVVAQRCRDEFGPALAFQLLVYPVTDLTLSHPSMEENAEGYFLTRDTMVWFRSCYVGERDPRDPKVSPLFAQDLSGLPPALVITAEYDPLRDEGEAYAARLREAGVHAVVHRYEGQIHGFLSLVGLIDDAAGALERAAAALRDALA